MSSFGHFADNKTEYVITNYSAPPRPLLNYLWNRYVLSGVNHFGGGEGAYGGRALAYISPEGLGRCSILRDANRYFYIKDMETGAVFNPGWYPCRTPIEHYSCRHGLGYSVIESRKDGLRVSARVFVNETDPCEIWTLRFANESGVPKHFKVFSFADFQLDGYVRYSDYNSYVSAEYDEANSMIVCHNHAIERPHDWFDGFMSSDVPPSGFDTARIAFLGRYGDIHSPHAVQQGKCSGRIACCEKMSGVLEHTYSLLPGQETELNVLIGATDCADTARQCSKRLFGDGRIAKDFKALRELKLRMCESIEIRTPDEKLDTLVNSWIKQQVQLCAEAGRDTGKGFRDQLQDAWAIASFNGKLAREKILETLKHQYSDGRCVRGWLPLDNHIYSDGMTWIAPVINAYIKETDDRSILMEKVPYLDGGEATVWEHMLAAVRFSSDDAGEHGLVHARDGDWNDSLNMIGTRGKGESVWTTIALYYALNQMAEMADCLMNDGELAREMLGRAEMAKNAVNSDGWDGEWFLAAINDYGERVGSSSESEGKIFLNSQTWAVLSGIADKERLAKCMDAVDRNLDSDYGPLTLWPTYTRFNGRIGRLTGFEPGIWENGTPYCHGGAFKVVADCILGRGDIALDTIHKILPDSKKNPSDYSGCEPYALTNMYLGPDNPRRGQTLFAWVTGTAGWMFRAVTQYIMGFYPGYDNIRIDPCIPSSWKIAHMNRQYRGDTYHITIENPDGCQKGVSYLIVDGKKITGSEFKIFLDGRSHDVTVVMKAAN